MYPWNKFPYSNLNKLNLAWIIQEVQSVIAQITSLGQAVEDLQDEVDELSSTPCDAFVNVVKFGAKGDGVTDDSAAIQKAVDTLTEGGRCYFPAGIYELKNHIDVPANVELYGDRGATVIRPTYDNVDNPVLLEINNADSVTMRDLIIDGNYLTHGSFDNVITVYQCEDFKAHDNLFRNTKGVALLLSTDIKRSEIKHNVFYQCGIYNTFSGQSADRKQSIAYTSGSKAENTGNQVLFNKFLHCGLDCISFTNQSDGLIEGNRVYKNYSGTIYVSTSDDVKVIGNHVENTLTGGNGIDVANGCIDIVIDGNTCKNCGAAGILVSDVTNCTIGDNVTSGNVQDATTVHRGGITIAATTGEQTKNVTVSGNVSTDNQGTKTQDYGVMLYDGGGTFSDVFIGFDNLLDGNKLANLSDNAVQRVKDTRKTVLNQEETADVCPNTVFGKLTVVRVNDNQFGEIYLRGTQNPIVLFDRTGGIFEVTDTGSEIAVYNDGSRIVIKSKTASTNRIYLYKLEVYDLS